MFKVIRLTNGNFRWIHCSCSLGKRHSRPGFVVDVGSKELIIDKPPNEYPNIQQKLARINYYDNPLNTKNIGFEENSEPYQNFLRKTENIVLNNSKTFIEGESLNFDDEARNLFLSKEEYDKLSSFYPFTKQYINSIIELAHHYAIFRDLFFQEPYRNQTCQDLIAPNAKDDVKLNKIKHKELFYFIPLVPINAEFVKQIPNEEVSCLKSFRGNLIPPEYGAQSPIIQIDTSGINDSVDMSDISDVSSESLITLNCGQKQDPNYYTLVLVNLDSHFSDAGVCHWIVSNIHRNDNQMSYDILVKYLPIYAIRGLGYHRYAFVLFQHEKKLVNLEFIEDFDLIKRKFNGLEFISECYSKNKASITPVGLSWFQTTWSNYCKDLFHNVLDMRCPTYEYIFPAQVTQFNQLQYPGRAPFNLYLDSFRDPKELSKEVLLERLKFINPMGSYDTEKMFPSWEGRPKFPHIHPHLPNTPDWLKSTMIRKRSHIGRFRGLRASSAILPYNNNADLDAPKWPRISSDIQPLNIPNPYPDGKRRPKPLSQTLWTKPLPEHHSLRIDHVENLKDEDKIEYDKTPLA